MTGYAQARQQTDDWTLRVSIKSVNHRFLDLHLRLPGGTESLEMQLRRVLKQKLVRGHIEVTLNIDRGQRSEISYDAALIEAYLRAFRSASAQHGLLGEPDLNSILRLPGVFNADSRSSDRGSTDRSEEDVRALEAAVLAELPALIDSLNAMRAQEGAALAAELTAGLDRLQQFVDEAAALREDVRQAYFERISQRISEMLNGALNGGFDRDRVLQEAALLAERSDVDEEVTRLRTHIDHFRSLIEGGGEIGKKLDFLLQEMNREANTLLSKTGGVAGNGPRITELGLGMKSEIEKAREQVQNLE